MEPLSAQELARFAAQFAHEATLLSRGNAVIESIKPHLAELNRREPKVERDRTLEELANSLIENLERYSIGAGLSLIAWTTRNILELDTILSFVTDSTENVKSFTDDIVLDEIEVREAGAALGFDRDNPEVARRQDEALGRLRDLKLNSGIGRKSPMRTSEMARKISQAWADEYRRYDKLYSKLVHPTAYLLLGGLLETTNWRGYSMHMMLQGVDRAERFLKRWVVAVSGKSE